MPACSGQGLAFLEVISPCVTYQDIYSNIESRLLDLDSDPDHDASDRGAAFLRSLEANQGGVIPVGVVYSDSSSSPAARFSDPPHAELGPSAWAETYEDFMSTHRV